MPSLEAALRYPMDSDDWVTTVLVGGVLSVFGFLLLPLVFVYGYLVRVVRRRLEDDPVPPTFDDWGDLFSDGLRGFVVVLVYMLVPAVVGAATVGGSIAAMATGTRGGAAAGVGGLLLGLLLTTLLALVFGYAAAAALVNFVREDRLGAAFDVGLLRDVVTTREYAVAWLLSVVVLFGASLVAGALNAIPLLGAVVGAFLLFYAQVSAAKLWADGVAAAVDATRDRHRAPAGESSV